VDEKQKQHELKDTNEAWEQDTTTHHGRAGAGLRETALDTAPCITFGLIIGGKITSGFVHSILSVDGIYVDGQMSVLSCLVLEDL
jgi:hypothetical protein